MLIILRAVNLSQNAPWLQELQGHLLLRSSVCMLEICMSGALKNSGLCRCGAASRRRY